MKSLGLEHIQNELTSEHLATILEGATEGYIDTLIVMEGNQRFGKCDPKTMHLLESNEQDPGSTDRIDEAAAQIFNGGMVHTSARGVTRLGGDSRGDAAILMMSAVTASSI